MTTSYSRRSSRWEEIVADELFKLADGPGVYAIFLDGKLFYIGSGLSLRNRISSHYRPCLFSNAYFTRWGYKDSVRVKIKRSNQKGDWLMDEFRLLKRLKPEGNKLHCGRARK